ncbi:MAG: hypothetical protein JW759_10320 [Candidatus Coatesbacteria bacterium]|nr:hypothetical protein [Candidatus Coatesbacteria bacterium]
MASKAQLSGRDMLEDGRSTTSTAEPDRRPDENRPGEWEETDLRALLRVLPQLLKEHEGEYALIIDGEVVRTDPDESVLLEYVYAEFPDADGLIQPIQEQIPGARPEARSIDDAERAEEERRREIQKKNLQAFRKMLPKLLKEHASKYALIVNCKLERIDADLQSIIDYAYSRFPNALGLIQPIQKKLSRVHMGSPKLLAR